MRLVGTRGFPRTRSICIAFVDQGIPEGHVEPAASPHWKSHDIQASTGKDSDCQRNKPSNSCPVVEDGMNEEDMDDKEEQPEQSRAVRG